MPGLMGASESSAADFAAKAFVIPLGSAFSAMKKALVPKVYQGMGLAKGSRARWGSLSKALVGLCRFVPCETDLFSLQRPKWYICRINTPPST